MSYFCHHCHKELKMIGRVGRGESCPHCNSDLHCCFHCIHYEPLAYNECREPIAERVLEKDRSNFCESFSFVADRRPDSPSPEQDAKARLEALFRKGI